MSHLFVGASLQYIKVHHLIDEKNLWKPQCMMQINTYVILQQQLSYSSTFTHLIVSFSKGSLTFNVLIKHMNVHLLVAASFLQHSSRVAKARSHRKTQGPQGGRFPARLWQWQTDSESLTELTAWLPLKTVTGRDAILKFIRSVCSADKPPDALRTLTWASATLRYCSHVLTGKQFCLRDMIMYICWNNSTHALFLTPELATQSINTIFTHFCHNVSF